MAATNKPGRLPGQPARKIGRGINRETAGRRGSVWFFYRPESSNGNA
jgi:hypothetical protein